MILCGWQRGDDAARADPPHPAHLPEQLHTTKTRAQIAAIADHPQELRPGDLVVRQLVWAEGKPAALCSALPCPLLPEYRANGGPAARCRYSAPGRERPVAFGRPVGANTRQVRGDVAFGLHRGVICSVPEAAP